MKQKQEPQTVQAASQLRTATARASSPNSQKCSARPTRTASPTGTARQQGRKKSPFIALLSLPEGRRFTFSALVARLPMSMLSLGTVLAIQHLYKNWSSAGVVSAIYVLSAAVMTPVFARWFDRYGQRKVGNIALPLSNIFLALFIVILWLRLPLPVVIIGAILLGATQFSFGALARTRWTWLLRTRTEQGILTQQDAVTLLSTAYTLESAFDELLYIIGPILATTLATAVSPISQLIVPLIAQILGGTIFFALHSATANTQALQTLKQPVTLDTNARKPITDQERLKKLHPTRSPIALLRRFTAHSALGFPGVPLLVISFVAYTTSFSAYDVGVVALAKSHGMEAISGLLLAIYSVGSLCGALIYGSRTWKSPLWRRYVTFVSLLVIGFILLDLTKDVIPLFIPVAFISGLVISPAYATANMIIEDSVPGTYLTEGLSWMNTAAAIGSSIGSSIVGVIIDHFGADAAFNMPWMCVLLAAAIVLVGRRDIFARKPKASTPVAAARA